MLVKLARERLRQADRPAFGYTVSSKACLRERIHTEMLFLETVRNLKFSNILSVDVMLKPFQIPRPGV